MLLPLYDENPTRRWPILTVTLVAANILAFVYVYNLEEPKQRQVVAQMGFVPERLTQWAGDGQPVKVDLYPELKEAPGPPPPGLDRFLVLQPRLGETAASLFTCMFLHAGIFHLAGNMWFLWIFGNNIEDRLGHFLFIFFYLVGGVLATMCHWAVSAGPQANIPMVGASGAVSVLLGAYIVTYPTARIRCLLFLLVIVAFPNLPAWVVLIAWFLMQLFQSNADPELPVAWWAHIGGFLLGVALMPLLALGTSHPREDWEEELRRKYEGVDDRFERTS